MSNYCKSELYLNITKTYTELFGIIMLHKSNLHLIPLEKDCYAVRCNHIHLHNLLFTLCVLSPTVFIFSISGSLKRLGKKSRYPYSFE